MKDQNVTPEQIARKFSAILTEWLGVELLEYVCFLNSREEDKSICHTHDYCDSNQAMIDAVEFFGIEWVSCESGDENFAQFTNEAWQLAKDNLFFTKEKYQ